MNPDRWLQIEQIFHSARELHSDERAGFITCACAGDPELRDEVGSLLRESDDAGEFLAESALSLGVALLARAPCVPSDGPD